MVMVNSSESVSKKSTPKVAAKTPDQVQPQQAKLAAGDDGALKISTHVTDLQKAHAELKMRKRDYKSALKSFKSLRSTMKYLNTPISSEDE